jgi:Domain of unknown function (DUF397)
MRALTTFAPTARVSSPGPGPAGVASWRKSSYSGYNGNCVEVARFTSCIGVRDTKADAAGPVLLFSRSEWNAFISAVKEDALCAI